MGLKKFSANFNYLQGSSASVVNVVSPVVEEGVDVQSYNNILEINDSQNYGCGVLISNLFSCFDLQYYWNSAKEFNLAKQIVKGTQYSNFKDYLDAFYAMALAEYDTPVAFSKTLDSDAFPQFSSKEQGCYGPAGNNTFSYPFIRIIVEGTTVSPQLTRDARIQFEFWFNSPSSFNSQTGLWQRSNVSERPLQVVMRFSKIFVLSEFDSLKERFYSNAIGISVMPGMQVSKSGGMSPFSYGPPSNFASNWYMFKNLSAITNSFPAWVKVCGTNNWNAMTVAWNQSGEVDPTDPWEEPDPYEPVDPPPGPPGPVDPVDPVDPVPDPDYPPIDGTSVGIYKVYKPSDSQLRSIAAKLWDPTAWDAIKQMFTNPMDSIFGLAIVPVEPHTAGSENVYLGRYNTQVQAPRVVSEYVTVDCGSVFISKFYGSYLDHDPYTKYTLYLPYVGELDINADEITGKTVSIKYHCNVVTGDTVAVVLIDGRACYTAMGNIIRQLPLSQVDFSSVIQTAVSAAATVLTSATAISSGIASEGLAIASGNTSAAISGQSRVANAAAQGVASTLNNVASTKLGYKHAGKIGQGAAQMAVQKPFFTVTRPNLLLPEGIDGARNSSQKRYTGYPANFIDELRNFHGLTVVEECQLNMLGATDSEIAEATAILKGGAYL